MVRRNSSGQVVRVLTYSGPAGMRNGDWRHERTDAGLIKLDGVAAVKVAYSGPGYRIRKAVR